ncbi:hypothetical protein DOTSEDRAFT_56737 [Dothistroma septosporum NZE10]|uniref:ATP-grasp domain-containing protein n=1 Tax=Dothistroma septosporum (strain NZE10 / CBS 128990) TaxID=675120 RepID=M2XIN5_DOTSN|nr:hypothetical protein DOTSEDRAFT_56737 [Dothistroma septosporum NZE10]
MGKDPIADIGLTFLATKPGEAIFLGASEPMIEISSSWFGSTITYHCRDEMKRELSPIMTQTASWLYEHRYSGPVGADILQIEDGVYQIIDMNVGASESMCLPSMKTHFTSRRLRCGGVCLH